jgi:hypothetical protein
MSIESSFPILRAVIGVASLICLIAAHYFSPHEQTAAARTRRFFSLLLAAIGLLLFAGSFLCSEAKLSQIFWARLLGKPLVLCVFGILYVAFLIPLFRRNTSSHKRTGAESIDFVFRAIEVSILVVGLIFAFHEASRAIEALKQNTESNMMVGRGQLYQSDTLLSQIESQESDGKLLTLYANAEPECANAKEAREYIADTLAVATSDPKIISSRNAEELYSKMYDLKSFAKFDPKNLKNESGDVIELRRISTHCVLILNTIHSAYDYCGEGVITPKEFRTWAGYFNDIGPHPVFLATIWNWEQERYMSKGFAKYVQHKLYTHATPGIKQVVKEFYPHMADENYGNTLPDYGNSEWEELIRTDVGQNNKTNAPKAAVAEPTPRH